MSGPQSAMLSVYDGQRCLGHIVKPSPTPRAQTLHRVATALTCNAMSERTVGFRRTRGAIAIVKSINRNAAAEVRGVPETDQLGGRVNRENSLTKDSRQAVRVPSWATAEEKAERVS
jgi:hypothetical protein